VGGYGAFLLYLPALLAFVLVLAHGFHSPCGAQYTIATAKVNVNMQTTMTAAQLDQNVGAKQVRGGMLLGPGGVDAVRRLSLLLRDLVTLCRCCPCSNSPQVLAGR
jgi:hypothetical protein